MPILTLERHAIMAGDTGGRAIFISYRRDDSEGEAGRLFDDLVRAFGENSVFMDVAGIRPGLDFRKAIDENVATCGVLLAIVGPQWASMKDAHGTRRLDNENDFVRLEIASALTRNVAVIPVLVHEAKMPSADLLPENLRDFSYRNSVELTHARWNSDVALLVNALQSYVTVSKDHATETVHATLPVQLPPPASPPHTPVPAPKPASKVPLFAGAGVAVALALGIGLYIATHGTAPPPHPDSKPVVVPAISPPGPSPTTQPAAPASEPAPTPAPAPAGGSTVSPIAPFVGRWQTTAHLNPQDSMERISVANGGSQLLVHAWGKCAAGECDWGVQPATIVGANAVTTQFALHNTPDEVQRGRSAVVTLAPSGDGLDVTVKSTYATPGKGPPDMEHTFHYLRITGPT